GLNAEFEPGRLYCIVGKSGAGKTSLLSLLAGLDICTEGAIQYEGEDLRELDRDRYRAEKIGVIFQSYNLLLNKTALE
ncbi:ATP-binding cassette domain-containing protein, partial [Agathobaculum butyriciproducens]|nr:ATP-binding cassette domain-containing protein [Agathobaculum butyriciproducens]